MSLLVLGSNDVEGIINITSPDILMTLMASVFVRLSLNDRISMPHRAVISSQTNTTLFMPSSIDDVGTSIKVVSVPKSGMPGGSTIASTLLLDETSGAAKALINAGSLTALRTAAGSLLATKLLLSKAPKVLVAFGAGAQVKAHVHLLLETFDSFTDCIIVNRNMNDRLEKLLNSLKSQHSHVCFRSAISFQQASAAAVKQAVSSADVICTATPSTEPLFPSHWVRPGTHINLVGSYTPDMVEVDSVLIRRCGRIVVDSKVACMVEAGDLLKAQLTKDDLLEIGEIVDGTGSPVSGAVRGAQSLGDVTIFKSVGVGLQDTAIADFVFRKAQELGVGTRVDGFS